MSDQPKMVASYIVARRLRDEILPELYNELKTAFKDEALEKLSQIVNEEITFFISEMQFQEKQEKEESDNE